MLDAAAYLRAMSAHPLHITILIALPGKAHGHFYLSDERDPEVVVSHIRSTTAARQAARLDTAPPAPGEAKQ
jgi:hypothetical protein